METVRQFDENRIPGRCFRAFGAFMLAASIWGGFGALFLFIRSIFDFPRYCGDFPFCAVRQFFEQRFININCLHKLYALFSHS